MPRPAGSYRGARRNEAKQSKKPMLTLEELRRINAMRIERTKPENRKQNDA
jgi:hypothetical protein